MSTNSNPDKKLKTKIKEMFSSKRKQDVNQINQTNQTSQREPIKISTNKPVKPDKSDKKEFGEDEKTRKVVNNILDIIKENSKNTAISSPSTSYRARLSQNSTNTNGGNYFPSSAQTNPRSYYQTKITYSSFDN